VAYNAHGAPESVASVHKICGAARPTFSLLDLQAYIWLWSDQTTKTDWQEWRNRLNYPVYARSNLFTRNPNRSVHSSYALLISIQSWTMPQNATVRFQTPWSNRSLIPLNARGWKGQLEVFRHSITKAEVLVLVDGVVYKDDRPFWFGLVRSGMRYQVVYRNISDGRSLFNG